MAVARAWTATHALLAIPLERKVTSTPEALRAERDELLDVTIPNALAVAVVDLERASATHALASLRVVGSLLGYGRATEASAAATMRAIRAARGEAAPPTGPRLGDEFHLFVDTSDRNTSETAALGACVVRAAHAAVKSSKLRKNAPAWAAAVEVGTGPAAKTVPVPPAITRARRAAAAVQVAIADAARSE